MRSRLVIAVSDARTSTLISAPLIGHSQNQVFGLKTLGLRRRHAISPNMFGHYQDLGISSYKGVILCRGAEISVMNRTAARARRATHALRGSSAESRLQASASRPPASPRLEPTWVGTNKHAGFKRTCIYCFLGYISLKKHKTRFL